MWFGSEIRLIVSPRNADLAKGKEGPILAVKSALGAWRRIGSVPSQSRRGM
jgi:hypothetical protein